ncbi:MAG: hypothetical protein QM736_22920 [Vicinamibacterales bacterium]
MPGPRAPPGSTSVAIATSSPATNACSGRLARSAVESATSAHASGSIITTSQFTASTSDAVYDAPKIRKYSEPTMPRRSWR